MKIGKIANGAGLSNRRTIPKFVIFRNFDNVSN